MPRWIRPASAHSSRSPRQPRPDIKLGICAVLFERESERRYLPSVGCGEHGGDPDSVKFFHKVGLSYVSCSPLPRLRLRPSGCLRQAVSTSFRLRVPVARLAAAQAAIEEKRAAKKK